MHKFPNESYVYFITNGRIDINSLKLNRMHAGRYASTPSKALVKFMKSQYDTFLSDGVDFIVSDDYSMSIYNYKINLYRMKSKYIPFINKYNLDNQGTFSDAIFVDGEVLHLKDIIEEVDPDTHKFLYKSLKSMGFDIRRVDTEAIYKQSYKQQEIAIDEMNLYINNLKNEESFIRPNGKMIPYSDKVAWSFDMLIGEYDISESVGMDMEGATVVLHEMCKKINDKLDDGYMAYTKSTDYDVGYGEVRMMRTESIHEHNINAPRGRSLWNTILESGDGFCGIDFDIKDLYHGNVVECVDLTKMIRDIPDRYLLTESKKVYGGEYSPVFIVLTDTGSMFSKAIKRVTNAPYNHVSVSFDPDLETLYSFASNGVIKRAGFNIETIKRSYLDRFDKVNTQIYTVFVNQNQLKGMDSYLDSMLANYKNARYNFTGLLGYIIQKPMGNENKKFCSEFVDELFKQVDIDLTNKKSGLVEPYDFARSESEIIFKVFEGDIKDVSGPRITTAVDRIFKDNRRVITEDVMLYEAKSFPVQFDKDGNLLIKNMRKLDYQSEYEDSHRLMGVYEKSKNLEGIRYELSKLWFLNSLIEEELYARRRPNKRKEKELIDIRARILNDFHKYLVYIGDHDSRFNFREYYDNTPFSDAEIQINKHTIDGIGKIVKSMLNII